MLLDESVDVGIGIDVAQIDDVSEVNMGQGCPDADEFVQTRTSDWVRGLSFGSGQPYGRFPINSLLPAIMDRSTAQERAFN